MSVVDIFNLSVGLFRNFDILYLVRDSLEPRSGGAVHENRRTPCPTGEQERHVSRARKGR